MIKARRTGIPHGKKLIFKKAIGLKSVNAILSQALFPALQLHDST
ncbi:hypothetical protein [Agriterribacter humi]|jgi:hypothetical protein|nr:hypothetical protein [Agriterribacter humi]